MSRDYPRHYYTLESHYGARRGSGIPIPKFECLIDKALWILPPWYELKALLAERGREMDTFHAYNG